MFTHMIDLMVVILIDISYSMDEDDYPPSRLKAACEAAWTFIYDLSAQSPTAVVGIVVFSGKARWCVEPVNVGRLDIFKTAMDALSTDASTNIAAGLKCAAKALGNAGGLRRQVILLTDGDHNCIGSPIRTAKKMKDRGIVIDVIGIGGSPEAVNEKDLKEIATFDTHLHYRWIGSKQQLISHYRSLAKDLSL